MLEMAPVLWGIGAQELIDTFDNKALHKIIC